MNRKLQGMEDEGSGPVTTEPWTSRTLPLKEEWCADFGPLQLLLRSRDEELQVAAKRCPGRRPQSAKDAADDLSWKRWPGHKNWRSLKLTPCLPDLSVVVKAENPLVLHPKRETLVYLRCPVWVRILINDHETEILDEIPIVLLSRTWFGIPTEGSFCYWISSGLRRTMEPDRSRPYLAICPVRIENLSGEDLLVERIRLRVEALSLYAGDGHFWCNEFRVAYHGSQSASDITVADSPPKKAGKLQLVTQPRKPIKETIAARTFRTLIDVAGLSGWSE